MMAGKAFEQPVVLAGATFRQLYVRDLGHEDATILLTNDRHATAAKRSRLSTSSPMPFTASGTMRSGRAPHCKGYFLTPP